MTGPYDSVIGVTKETILQKFRTNMPIRFEPATGDVRFCAVIIDCDPVTGRASSIERLMLDESLMHLEAQRR
ncbi:MAG TPA: YmdB family metallophosphoesterase, partial [Terriglobales bacterium]|nr:YmdB family metallophosphoesterase [Terriglobales bacterium]